MRTWGTPLKNPQKKSAPDCPRWDTGPCNKEPQSWMRKNIWPTTWPYFLWCLVLLFFYSTLNDHRNRPCTIEQLSSAHSSGFNCRPLQACFGPSENWMFQIMPEKYMLSPISWVPSVESQLKPRATEPRNLLGTPWVATGRPFAHRQRSCCTAPRAPDVLRDHPPAPWAPPVSWNVR